VPARRHPPPQALVPHQQRPALPVDDERGGGEVALHSEETEEAEESEETEEQHGENAEIIQEKQMTALSGSQTFAIVGILGFFGSLGLLFCMALVDSNSTVLNIGDTMPEFTLKDTNLDDVRSEDIRQDIVVVVFTCNHCPYAQACEQRLIDIDNEFFEEGDVRMILINSNDGIEYPDDSFAEMKKRVEEKGYPFSYCHDDSQAVAKAFGALCTPHCFVFDKQRKLRYKGRVDDNWKDPAAVKSRDLYNAIKAVSTGEKVPVEEANAIGCSMKWKRVNEPK
jgi:peroxiredoxin